MSANGASDERSSPPGSKTPGSLPRAFAHGARGFWGDVRASWDLTKWFLSGIALAAALVPVVVHDPAQMTSIALGLYLVLATVGLNFAVGAAGMPSLGQGAFVGAGAFGAAWLEAKAGWSFAQALPAAVAIAAGAGLIVGAGAARLRPAYIAISTWVVSWLGALALAAFPALSGGVQGLVVAPARVPADAIGRRVLLTPTGHYELALVLIVGALIAYQLLARGPAGLGLSALRQGRAAADAIGVDAFRLQIGAFVASAAIGGAGGALSVHLSGVADPTAYGPLLSLKLFVAVLLGGAGTVLGPVVGASVLAIIPAIAQGLGAAAGIAPERFEPVIAALLLIAALLVASAGGLTRQAGAFIERRRGPRRRSVASPTSPAQPRTIPPPLPGHARVLEATGLSKHFGGVTALEGVDLALESGTIRALIGPNGSGKTTMLKVLAGGARPDEGRVTLLEHEITTLPVRERIALGLTRTLQQTAIWPEMSALDHVIAGSDVTRRYGGTLRWVLQTPLARAENARIKKRAMEALELVGLADVAGVPAANLSSADQRLLMVAMAYAPHPHAILLDEPSAGMSLGRLEVLRDSVANLRDLGLAVLVVEHNLRLIRDLADHVTVLDAGRVIGEGTPAEVAQLPAVREAYLGPAGL